MVSDPLTGLRNLHLLGMGAIHVRAQADATDLVQRINDVRDVNELEAGCLCEAIIDAPTPPSTTLLSTSSTTTSSPRTRSPTWSVYNSCRAEGLLLELGLLLAEKYMVQNG